MAPPPLRTERQTQVRTHQLSEFSTQITNAVRGSRLSKKLSAQDFLRCEDNLLIRIRFFTGNSIPGTGWGHSFAADDPEPSHHFAQESPQPWNLVNFVANAYDTIELLKSNVGFAYAKGWEDLHVKRGGHLYGYQPLLLSSLHNIHWTENAFFQCWLWPPRS